MKALLRTTLCVVFGFWIAVHADHESAGAADVPVLTLGALEDAANDHYARLRPGVNRLGVGFLPGSASVGTG